MKTKTQEIIYPGNHGQASYCHYKIAFDDNSARPRVVVLIWDAETGNNTPLNNSSITDDTIVNLILEKELKGLQIMDILFITPHEVITGGVMLKKLPTQHFARQELNHWERAKRWCGLTQEQVINVSDKKCGDIKFQTSDPVALSDKERVTVLSVLPELESLSNISQLYSMYCNTTNTQEVSA